MSIIDLAVMLPHVGQARAHSQGRPWFLVRDTATGAQRLTDNPGAPSRETILAVYSPCEGDWHNGA